ncbi:D-alanine--D-alanine ligase [Vibrio sp. S4M6]|uniref:D-alanine--D-alanine ligase n=1 Tax=Vibrio sinus TaxID=2946865 RepID=UPI00202A026C|nr:D-alanine--D-alanine ligase [Vibrio sinus]MCL9783310.1 D-alanine--D-alanine ligase [Vibrio sinus]
MRSRESVQCIEQGRVNAGMPLIDLASQRSVSPYEFLPGWLFYTPVVIQSLFQGLRYADWRLPLIANPSIHLSGMVGESKHDILSLAGDKANQWISPFITLTKSELPESEQLTHALTSMSDKHLNFPVVAKPDMGCRGAGVKLIQDKAGLEEYIHSFPVGARYLLQEKAPYQAEAGVFYVRYPGEERGKIFSITLKYAPVVVGDGEKTLEQLIAACPRAGKLQHLYRPRHEDKLQQVIAKGEEFQLAFSGSHCRGSIFRDGNQFITEKLASKLDQIFNDIDGFHYGRLDIKFKDINQFMRGEDFTILEINGASSEAAHIWDSRTPLTDIFSTLLTQYRILFDIGAKQKQRGHKAPSITSLLKAWKEEKILTAQYPSTD